MNVFLLYPNREWVFSGQYYDARSIIQDLELNTIFSTAATDIISDKKKLPVIGKEDPFLFETIKKVVMVPLHSSEEILYRQSILKDFLSKQDLVRDMYSLISDMMKKWDEYGRKTNENRQGSSPQIILANEIKIMKLLTDTLSELKKMVSHYNTDYFSKGLNDFVTRLSEDFSKTFEENMYRLLEDISFYIDVSDKTQDKMNPTMMIPHLVVECGIGDGLKLGNFTLEDMATRITNYKNPYGILSTVQDYVKTLSASSISIYKNAALQDQVDSLAFQVVSHVMECCVPFRDNCKRFFDQLYSQIAFYRAAVNLHNHMLRLSIQSCMPTCKAENSLSFSHLKEVAMAIKQGITVVGNTLSLEDKMLLIITGANQGGKSTFLRSVGIAQIMMQCGLFVAATQYESGIFPSFFTHFTRREDSSMNSGRLDEELKRMNQIIENLGDSSLLLLNESFASTTEKEGSEIAYEIIRALHEKGVKIITVTHLLSFAQKMYDESTSTTGKKIAFLSAERLDDGQRTYKMIDHAPELTSFGLDLYTEIIEQGPETSETAENSEQ